MFVCAIAVLENYLVAMQLYLVTIDSFYCAILGTVVQLNVYWNL